MYKCMVNARIKWVLYVLYGLFLSSQTTKTEYIPSQRVMSNSQISNFHMRVKS